VLHNRAMKMSHAWLLHADVECPGTSPVMTMRATWVTANAPGADRTAPRGRLQALTAAVRALDQADLNRPVGGRVPRILLGENGQDIHADQDHRRGLTPDEASIANNKRFSKTGVFAKRRHCD